MSAKIERRLRSIKKYEDETLSNISKYIISDNRQKPNSRVLSVTSFDYETLSTPLKLDINSEKRVHKKKIRSTQEFNQLGNSLTLRDSVTPSKTKAKKTKKSVRDYSLPRISQIAEDIFYSGNVQKRKVTGKSRKHGDAEHLSCENRREMIHKYKQSEVDRSEEDLWSQTKLNEQPKQNTEVDLSIEEYQSANSTISDSENDSGEEVIIRYKKKSKKTKSNGSSVNDDLEEVKLNTVEKYAKRIKKLLSDSLGRSSKSYDVSNSPYLATPLIDKKLKQRSSVKKLNTVQTKNEATPKNDRISICDTSPDCGINRGDIRKRSVSTRSSKTYTPHPKKNTISSDTLSYNIKDKQLRNTSCKKNSSEFFSPTTEVIKAKSKGSNQRNSTLTVNVSFDMDYDSDNVFEEKLFDRTNINKQEHIEDDSLLNNYSTTRKSVRFQSPQQKIQRETLILSKLPRDDSLVKPKPDECVDGIFTHNFSEDGDDKSDRTFEVTSPKVPYLLNSFRDVSQNQYVLNDSRNELNISYKHHGENVPQQSINSSTKESSPQLSPATKSCKKIKTSIVELTPVPKKGINPDRKLNSENDLNDVPIRLNRQSTFSIDDEVSSNSLFSTELVQTEKSKSHISLFENVPKLVRTSTFTKEDEVIKRTQDLPPDLNYSPLQLDSSYCKPLDTSKITRRKRWDKSRLSVSLLDSSLDIGNISAPWEKIESSNSSANIQKQSLEVRRSHKISDSNSNIKNNGSIPSGTSTPLPRNKTSLLRQALLKDNKNVTGKDNKSYNEHVEKPLPKIVRTKIPNFALIHQRAFDKLENIKEMSERKAARAKLLLSGYKPPSENIAKASTKRKELKFSPTRPNISIKESNNKGVNKLNVSVTKISKMSPSKSNLKVANKENKLTSLEKKKEALKAKSQIPNLKLPNTIISEKKGFTRFGFKIGAQSVKKTTKDEQVKAVANKTKVMKNTVEERRNIIQGVRSNRRFELIMKMRNK